MKRRKDSGFTLIELMIVIAVIGILAIVLIPRIGLVKSQAKETGLDTNIRVVQGYIESKIDRWVADNTSRGDVEDAIVAAFTFTDSSKELINPVTSVSSDAVKGNSAAGSGSLYVLTQGNPGDTGSKGTIMVVVDSDYATNGISLYAYGADGKLLPEKTVTIKP